MHIRLKFPATNKNYVAGSIPGAVVDPILYTLVWAQKRRYKVDLAYQYNGNGEPTHFYTAYRLKLWIKKSGMKLILA